LSDFESGCFVHEPAMEVDEKASFRDVGETG
jgi:hypothetical protein